MIIIKPYAETILQHIMGNKSLWCSVECYGEVITEATKDMKECLNGIDAVDECHIFFWESPEENKKRECFGWLYWIGYNGGIERLSDYSINFDKAPFKLSNLAEQWDNSYYELMKKL